MYSISSALKTQIDNFGISGITATVNGVNGSITLSPAEIMEQAFSIERKSVSGEKIEIGSAVTSELKMTLHNPDGKFDSFRFEGAEMYVWAVVKLDSGADEYIPLGYFIVDNQPRKLDTISLTALDRMVKFAKPYDSELDYPASLWTVLNDCCSKCGVSLATLKSALTNADYVVQARPQNDDITYWQMLQWVAELTGTCAWIDWDGKLRLTWYTDSSALTLTPADRYSSDLQENDITITGVQIKSNDEAGTIYRSGSEGYMFNIDGNLLVQSDLQSIANKLGAKLNGFTYRPYTATTKCYPHLWPMDKITFTDLRGVNHVSVITNHTFKLNGTSMLAAKGEPTRRNGYASSAPFTARQNAILERNKAQVDNKITNAQQAQLELNEIMANSMGLFATRVPQPNGSVTVYYHNARTLESSTYIYTRNAGGFAWTNNGWNDGNPVWNYGIDKNGNAVLNAISVNKISGEYIEGDIISGKELHVKFKSGEEEIPIEEEFDKIERDADYLEQQFTAANGELLSSIEKVNSDLTENIDGVEKQVSDLRQTVDGFQFGISTTGGTNLIKNSVGYFDFDEWQHDGSVIVDRGLFIGRSSSRCGFVLSAGSFISQADILTWNGKEYTISFIVNQTAADKSTFTVEGAASAAKLTFADKEYSFAKQQITVTATEALTIKFSVETGESAISDLMCNMGGNAAVWSMAQGELSDTNFKFNNEGLTIRQSTYDGYMNIRADEIANYYQGKKTFSLDKDETEIEKLIAHKQIDMMPIKIIPITEGDKKGWAFVKLGG